MTSLREELVISEYFAILDNFESRFRILNFNFIIPSVINYILLSLECKSLFFHCNNNIVCWKNKSL